MSPYVKDATDFVERAAGEVESAVSPYVKDAKRLADEVVDHTPKFFDWAVGEVEDAVSPYVKDATDFVERAAGEVESAVSPVMKDAMRLADEHLPSTLGGRSRGGRSRGGRDRAAPDRVSLTEGMYERERGGLNAAKRLTAHRGRKKRRAESTAGRQITPDALSAIEQQLTPARLAKYEGLLADLEPARRPQNLVKLIARKRAEYGMAAEM